MTVEKPKFALEFSSTLINASQSRLTGPGGKIGCIFKVTTFLFLEKPSKPSVESKHDSELKAAVEKRKTTLEKLTNVGSKVTKDGELTDDEEESEVSESESECAKEREETRRRELEKIKEQGLAQMKAEEDRRKETERKLQEVGGIALFGLLVG